MKRRYFLFAAVAGAVSIIVAACGGADATPTPQPTATQPRPTATPAVAPTTTTAPAQPTATRAPGATATPVPARTATPVPPTPTVAGPQPKLGGVMTLRQYRDFRVWDTWDAAGGFTNNYVQSMVSNLVKSRRGTSEMIGDLAESWQVSTDGKTYTFKLRPGMQWHDGKPVTSRDILYNLKRGSDPRTNFNAARVAPIVSMETPDDLTFRLTIKDASNSFLAELATPFVLIYPAHMPDIAAWQKSPVGSGPFKFKEDKADTIYSFVKNGNYFLKDSAGRARPYLDALDFFVIPDVALAASALRSGKVDCTCMFAEGWVIDQEDALKRDIAGVNILRFVGTRNALYFNTTRAPFNNLAFRQATIIGLDKESIGAAYQGGKNIRPATELVPPELGGSWGLPRAELQKIPGWNPDRAKDVDLARQKFKESGIDPKGLKVELMLDGTAYKDVGELVASVLSSDWGMNATLYVSPSTVESTDRKVKGNYQVNLFTQGGATDDPVSAYATYLSTGGGLNWSGWSNARWDEMYKQQDVELDAAKRKQVVWDMQRLQYAEFPMATILWSLGVRATRPVVKNFITGPLTQTNFDLSEVWIER